MKIGITGASGFIGKHLVKALQDKFYQDHFLYIYNSKNLDIREKIELPQLDILYHLAACSSIYKCKQEPQNCWNINVRGTQNIVNAVQKAGINRIIYSSSTIIYAETVQNDPYKLSKKTAENIIIQSEIPYTILRISAPYGEGITRGPWHDIMNHKIFLHPNSVINFVPMEKVIKKLITSIDDEGNITRDVKGEDIKLLKPPKKAVGFSLQSMSALNNYGFYEGSMSNHDKVIQNVIDVLMGKDKIKTRGEEGLETVKVINAIYRSAQVHKTVYLR